MYAYHKTHYILFLCNLICQTILQNINGGRITNFVM